VGVARGSARVSGRQVALSKARGGQPQRAIAGAERNDGTPRCRSPVESLGDLALLQKRIGDRNRLVEQSARIVAIRVPTTVARR
jgi:hypothetical protein